MKKYLFLLLTFLCLSAEAKLTVGTTTTDLESLVKTIAKDSVHTFSIAKGIQDPHQIEAKPSFMIKCRDADLIISHGLELESAWLNPLIQGSRNSKIVIGSNGYLALGALLTPIEIEKAKVTRAEGDVHPDGNPHFQLDPIRMGKAALLIAKRMGQLDNEHSELFKKNAENIQKDLQAKTKIWMERIKKTGIKEFVSYHKTFSYFADRFQLRNTVQLEPKPGIPPTASHMLDVIQEMKARNIKIVFIENYFDDAIKTKLQDSIPDVKVFKLPVSIDGDSNTKNIDDLLENLVVALEKSTL